MGMSAPVYYSADMVRALPEDGNRYETVHGELLVTPAPTVWHQEIVTRLLFLLRDYLSRHPIGYQVLASPADISWTDDTLVQPDLFVADLEELRSLEWQNVKTLSLVIEVLSPSTVRYDCFTKRRLYQEVRVPAYWIVDPRQHVVEVWTPGDALPAVQREVVVWSPPGARAPLRVSLVDLFRAM